MRMPKPGYTTIIVKESVRSHLQELAEAQGYRSINQLLEAWLRVYPTNTNEKIRYQETNPETSPFLKNNPNFWWGRPDLNRGPERPKLGA